MHGSASLVRIDTETRSHHADADRPWLSLTRTSVARRDYVHQLVITYGFEAPLEAAFAYTKGLGDVIGLRERARVGRIVQDLLALGLEPTRIARLPQCFSITPFEDQAEALGWMYVVERATLLHDSVRRHLVGSIPELRVASSYLEAYDGKAAAKWRAFGHALDAHATTDAIGKHIAFAADHAFRRLRDWIDVSEQQQQRSSA